jgi:hypothetical protein
MRLQSAQGMQVLSMLTYEATTDACLSDWGLFLEPSTGISLKLNSVALKRGHLPLYEARKGHCHGLLIIGMMKHGRYCHSGQLAGELVEEGS